MSVHTEVLFVNHASVLIRHGDRYLLTDPWFQKPAFGSWLPIPPMTVHPAYLAALKDKLNILVSHGHDDHCDDELLPLFDAGTPVFSSDYASPGVRNRMRRLGFENYATVSREGIQAGPFLLKSYRNDAFSLDDAIYTIRTPDALIVHCNDCWFPLSEGIRAAIAADAAEIGGQRVLYMSQTNSASGFPLSYVDFTDEEKKTLLQSKVDKMIRTGMENASSVGARYFHSYAGFAGVFVKNHPDYLQNSIMPSPAYLHDRYHEQMPVGLEIVDLAPGDAFDFSNVSVRKSFFGGDIADPAIKEKTIRFYEQYGQINRCDSYQPPIALERDYLEAKLRFFLSEFEKFVVDKSQRSGFHDSVLGKIFAIEVSDLNLYLAVQFGQGFASGANYNKKMIVDSTTLMQVINGESLFENLYTGYNAQISRNPANEYNRDLVMYIVMFSYVYKNAIAPKAAEIARQTVPL